MCHTAVIPEKWALSGDGVPNSRRNCTSYGGIGTVDRIEGQAESKDFSFGATNNSQRPGSWLRWSRRKVL